MGKTSKMRKRESDRKWSCETGRRGWWFHVTRLEWMKSTENNDVREQWSRDVEGDRAI